MRKCYDAVTPGNIPSTAKMVAGYIDGRYAWKAADWARFPRAVKVRIAVFSATEDGHVLDVEPGCATPASAPGWVLRRRAKGVDPTIYCNLADWPSVRAAFRARKVREPHYWVAAYPGNGPALYPGSIAHQYQGGLTAKFDVSVVADYWPGVDPKPVPPKPPTKPTHPVPPGGDVPLTEAEANHIADLTVRKLLLAKLGHTGPNVGVALQHAGQIIPIDPEALGRIVADAVVTAMTPK
jgi:hypothetical protein